MAIKEFWIQIENRTWGAGLSNSDPKQARIYKETKTMAPPVSVSHASVGTGVRQNGARFRPVNGSKKHNGEFDCVKDVLILRRYKPPRREDLSDAWTVPDTTDDNPEGRHERDAIDLGLLITSPGPTIECSVGDDVIVHCRNNDQRKRIVTRMLEVNLPFGGPIMLPTPFKEPLPSGNRTHRLYPDCFNCSPVQDRTAPWLLPDPNQPVGSEAPLWREVGVTEYKKGDRVPPGGTFTYTWNTLDWRQPPKYPTIKTTRFVIKSATFTVRPG